MPVTFTTLSRQLNFHLSAETSGELAPFYRHNRQSIRSRDANRRIDRNGHG